MSLNSIPTAYKSDNAPVPWQGRIFTDDSVFETFMSGAVAERLNDVEGKQELASYLRGLQLTGFGEKHLEEVLNAEIDEERDWAVGEAMAEAWMSADHGVIWPWNMARDKRNPNASLPGADLIGFCKDSDETYLVLGEVKTSEEQLYPPQVMSGRSGMIHQIDDLATNLSTIYTLLGWLLPRCKNTEYQAHFNAAIATYLNSGKKSVRLFGILIRSTVPNELDLKNRAAALAKKLSLPTICNLIALYLPCKTSELFDKASAKRAT